MVDEAETTFTVAWFINDGKNSITKVDSPLGSLNMLTDPNHAEYSLLDPLPIVKF